MKSYYLKKNSTCPLTATNGWIKTNFTPIGDYIVKITDNNKKSQPGHRHGQASSALTATLPQKKSSGKINLFRGHLQLLILTTEITPNSDGPKLKVSATRLFHLEVV